jgi:hypothetical protein
MDAVTNFELEAERRRETVAIDRDQAWARAMSSAQSEEALATRAIVGRIASAGRPSTASECEPTPLARQPVG